jgi:hypothetical protein
MPLGCSTPRQIHLFQRKICLNYPSHPCMVGGIIQSFQMLLYQSFRDLDRVVNAIQRERIPISVMTTASFLRFFFRYSMAWSRKPSKVSA